MHSLQTLSGLLSSFFLYQSVQAQSCSSTCQSFGKDFIDGGSYFQNIKSTDDFTAWEEFQGCQNDKADNILVDPSGTQYDCNTTEMQPSNEKQLVTCPIKKDQLVSGNWSMIVISNNGQCAPIDYVRRFSLSVGEQSTKTVGPTVTFTSTLTPISSTILTSYTTIKSIAPPVKTTVENGGQKTVTIVPEPRVSIVTHGVFTYVYTKQIASIIATSTLEHTEPCQPTAKGRFAVNAVQQDTPDRVNKNIKVTVGSQAAPKATSRVKRAMLQKREVIEVRELAKRHPDSPITTIIGKNIPAVSTTETITGSTKYLTGTTTIVKTSTTRSTVTISKDQPIFTYTAQGLVYTVPFYVPVQYETMYQTSQVTATVTKDVSGC